MVIFWEGCRGRIGEGSEGVFLRRRDWGYSGVFGYLVVFLRRLIFGLGGECGGELDKV